MAPKLTMDKAEILSCWRRRGLLSLLGGVAPCAQAVDMSEMGSAPFRIDTYRRLTLGLECVARACRQAVVNNVLGAW